MAYTPVSQRNGAGADIKPKSVSGYVPVASRQTESATVKAPVVPVTASAPESIGGYTPVSKRPEGYVPSTPKSSAPVVAPVAPKSPSIVSKASKAVGNFFDTPDNKGQEMSTDVKKNTLKYLPSSIVESLPFGIGEIFKQIHEEEANAIADPSTYETSGIKNVTGKDLLQNTPKAVLEAGKEFVKAPIRGVTNVIGLTGKKIKFDIPGLGEVSNAQYKTAERVANGEDPVQVALEEGANSIFDTLFFAGVVAKAISPRPTTIMKGEMAPPQGLKTVQAKSFRLFEQPTTAKAISPAFMEKMRAQGNVISPKYDPSLPTYFRITGKANGLLKGEIVQLKPSYFSILKSKMKSAPTDGSLPAVISLPKTPPKGATVTIYEQSTNLKDIETASKKPMIVEPVSRETPAISTPTDVVQRADILNPETPAQPGTPETIEQANRVLDGTPPEETLTLTEKGKIASGNFKTAEEWVGSLRADDPMVQKPYKELVQFFNENKPEVKQEVSKSNKRIGIMDYHKSYTPNMNRIIKEAQDNGDMFPYSKMSPEEQKILDNAWKSTMKEAFNAEPTPQEKSTLEVIENKLIERGIPKEAAQKTAKKINILFEYKNPSEEGGVQYGLSTEAQGAINILKDEKMNPNSRAIFTEITGIKLPKTQRDSEIVLKNWLKSKDTEPQIKKEVSQKETVKKAVSGGAKTIKQISEETKILEPNVRRILGVGAKEGTFERVEKGVYILSKDGEDMAYIQTGDAVESLPKLAANGFKADMVFLDIPYDTPAVRGGNRGVEYNLISVGDFSKVLDAVSDIARTENTPVIHMYSQAESGLKAMQKYNDLFIKKGFIPVGKGELQKTYKNGAPVAFPTSKGSMVTKPEGILVFTKSGELNKKLENLNFKLVRPNGYQTEKPAEMLKAMIEMTTEEGDMVLDPFAGSGVTGAEAVKAGRKTHLIEKDAEVAKNITKPRVKEALELRPSEAKTLEESQKERISVGFKKEDVERGNLKTIPEPRIRKTDILNIVKASPEFKANPQFIVDAEKNLIFKGKNQTLRLKATALGLNADRLKEGEVITVNPESLKVAGQQQLRAYKGSSAQASIGAFRDGTPITLGQKENIKVIELPEMVDLARELMGEVPKIKNKVGRMFGGQARGVFRSGGKEGTNGSITLRADLFDSSVNSIEQVAKTLAHEIGHLIDYLPHKTLIRGNLMGRLNSLREFRKDFFAPAGQSRTNTEVTDQLWKLSQYWKPIDLETASPGFIEYRKSAKEIYADFISVIFNDPKLAQEMAPTAYNVFFEQLNKKPLVQSAFFDLQEILGGDRDAINARRRAGIKGMFDKGDMTAADIQRARLEAEEARKKDFLFKFKFNVIDKNFAMIDRLNALKKKGVQVPDDENPLFYLEERNYLGGKIKAFMERDIQPVYETLQKNEISWNDFGEALFYDRIRAGDRSDVANPRGITPKVAEELREKMFKELGEEKSQVITEQMEKFRGAIRSVAEEAYNEGLYKAEMYQQMKENPAYATFQVIDHIEEGMTSKVHKSIGTLKDITNPADASLLKTISTFRAIERNKVTRSVIKFLNKEFSGDAIPAKSVNTPKGTRFLESKLPNQDLVIFMENGKQVGHYVDPYISKSINNEDIGQTISVLRVMNAKLFRPLFITYNPGFQLTNFVRDIMRTWKNMPGVSFATVIKRYYQAAPVARARAFGNNANVILRKLESEQILSIPYNQMTDGADIEAKQIEMILRNSGIDSLSNPKVKYKALQPFIKVLDFISSVGDFIETLPKVAAYLEFSNGGVKEITREQKSYIRKNIGSPDFLAGGYWKPLTNEVFLFSNSITQGIRSDFNVATDPKTRGGYWFKTAKANILPKILMILAGAGVFGKEIEEIMDGASEYDKTNYIIVPLGKDSNGKSIYFRVPQDEGGRLMGGLAWKAMNIPNSKQSIVADVTDMVAFAGGQIPTATPAITNALATSQFLAGQNPYDWFRARSVLTDDQFKAGGSYAAKPFFGWLFNQAGGSVFYKFNNSAPKDQSKTEKIFNLPVFGNIAGRFIKVSDYGTTETLNKIKQDVQKEQARTRIDENEVINGYIKESQDSNKSIDELVSENKAKLVTDVLGHAPQTKDELTKANNIVKKYQVGLQRGESDPLINSLISATTNEEKLQLLNEIRGRVTKQEYNKLMLASLKYKIVSPEVFLKVKKPQ